MPIKCPVAPLEFAFLADWFLPERGVRDRTEIVYVTPLDSAFTKKTCADHLSGPAHDKEIELVTEFNAGEVDGIGGKLTSYDGRELDFDLLVTVPLHGGAAYVERSPGLGDALGFVPTDTATLQTEAKPNIFALGDATDLPTSKAGSVTHFEAEVLAENIARYFDGRGARGRLRRPRELLHRDRLPQGAAHRLQLRRRARAGALPVRPRAAAPARVARQPLGEAAVPVGLLARAPARARHPGHRADDADAREARSPLTPERRSR